MTDTPESGPSRRTLLATIGTVAGTGIAGCVGGDDGGSGDGDGEASGDIDSNRSDSSGDASTDSASIDDGSGDDGGSGETDGTTSDGEAVDADGTDRQDDEEADSQDDGETDDEASDEEEPAGGEGESDAEQPDETWAEAGPPNREEWSVTFQDDFADGTIDWDTWTLGGWTDALCTGRGVDVCYVEDHVRVDTERERLVLEASTETPETPPDALPREQGNDYSAGAVSTRDGFAQEFGYFEAAARIPDEPGTLPACWLFCDPIENDWRELELFEKFGAAPADQIKMGGWLERDPDGPDAEGELTDNEDRTEILATGTDGAVTTPAPADEAVHVFALEWGPESLTWYLDGERVGTVTDPMVAEHFPGEELFWILHYNVMEPAEWIGDPDDASFPSALEFEWVRAWQREDWR